MPGSNPPAAQLPSPFISKNSQDPAWLASLPRLLTRLAGRWSLSLDPPFAGIAWNYVAPATRADGAAVVLKVSRHLEETRNEIAALRLWDGAGAARLLDADPENGALLLERLTPGTMLTEVAEHDDDAATFIAAAVLRRLWRPPPAEHSLRSLESWCAVFDRTRQPLSQGAAGFPATLFRRADAARRDLLAATDAPTVLHGDLHHFNVLRSERAGWLAIDPKGLLGDRCFDLCQYLINPMSGLGVIEPNAIPVRLKRRRFDILCDELGLDRQRAQAWCFVHAMLNACWNFEDGAPWQRAVAYAEQTLLF